MAEWGGDSSGPRLDGRWDQNLSFLHTPDGAEEGHGSLPGRSPQGGTVTPTVRPPRRPPPTVPDV